MSKLDTDIDTIILSRMKQYCYLNNSFTECEKVFFEWFLSLGIDEIKTFIKFLPIGSIIFHGCTAPSYPSKMPPLKNIVDEKLNYTAIRKILNEETNVKAIGSINNDPNYTDEEKRTKIDEYMYNYKMNEKNGIFTGKHYLWCNTTMDTNIMVDIRMMQSMTVFVTNKDLYLLDYYLLSKKLLETGTTPFFKRWLNFDKSYIYPTDEMIQNNDPNIYTSQITINNIHLQLRNKYANSVGDGILLPLLNYVLSMKGFPFRIDGYTAHKIVINCYKLL